MMRWLLIIYALLIGTMSVQAQVVGYYHLRVEFTSTSDWAEFRILNSEHILSYRLVSVEGIVERVDTRRADTIGIYQSRANAQAGGLLRVTVDYALSPFVGYEPLRWLLERGSLNRSSLEVFYQTETGDRPLAEIMHDQPVAVTGGRNPLFASLDLWQLMSTERGQAVDLGAVPSVPPMLWAVYYLWYTPDFWTQYTYFDQPQQAYLTADDDLFARQIAQAQSANIDGFLASWWGPGNEIDRQFARLLDAAQAANFQIGMYFETLAAGQPRSRAEITDWLRYALTTYGDHPAWMKVNGAPVIAFWASETVSISDWRDILTQLASEGMPSTTIGMGLRGDNYGVFDGTHEYGVFGLGDLQAAFADMRRQATYAPMLDESPRSRLWMATVQPGYDERGIDGRVGLFREREDGDFYRETWRAALASDPDWIMITSWNEWPEHTYIEPSTTYGELFMDITREWAALWRGQGE
jgi:hypothetical protein